MSGDRRPGLFLAWNRGDEMKRATRMDWKQDERIASGFSFAAETLGPTALVVLCLVSLSNPAGLLVHSIQTLPRALSRAVRFAFPAAALVFLQVPMFPLLASRPSVRLLPTLQILGGTGYLVGLVFNILPVVWCLPFLTLSVATALHGFETLNNAPSPLSRRAGALLVLGAGLTDIIENIAVLRATEEFVSYRRRCVLMVLWSA